MAGIQTSNITTKSGDDLTITPNNGQTLIKSVTTNNPGVTPVAASSDGTVKKFIITDLSTKSTLEDNDWVVVHDSATGNTVRVPGSEFGGGGTLSQPPFKDPLPETGAPWVDEDAVLAVKAGGNGSTADLKNSVEFAVQNDTYNQSDKNVTQGSVVKVRWIQSKLDSASHGQTVSGTLYAKSGPTFEQTWNLSIVKQPTANWDIPPKVDQPLSALIVSDLVMPTGMTVRSPVTIDGGTLTSIEVSVNGQPWTNNPGYIESGQPIMVRGLTGASGDTVYTAQVSIGGLQRTWNVTTESATAGISCLTGAFRNVPNLSGSYDPTDFASQWQFDLGTPIGHPGPVIGIKYKSFINGVEFKSGDGSQNVNLSWFYPWGRDASKVPISPGDDFRVEWYHYTSQVDGDTKFVEGTYGAQIKQNMTCATLNPSNPPPQPGQAWEGGYYVGQDPYNNQYIVIGEKKQCGTNSTGSGALYDNPPRTYTGHYVTERQKNAQQSQVWACREGGYNDWYTPTNNEMSAYLKG